MEIDIYDLLHIVNDKGAGVTLRWIMHLSQPDLKICKRAVPAEKLYDKSKDNPSGMDSFAPFIPPAYKCAEDEEYYPEEVKKDCDVCGDPVEHEAFQNVNPSLSISISPRNEPGFTSEFGMSSALSSP